MVELGTATGWTAISLALAAPARTVTSLDVVSREEPLRYLQLVGALGPAAASSCEIRDGAQGPVRS